MIIWCEETQRYVRVNSAFSQGFTRSCCVNVATKTKNNRKWNIAGERCDIGSVWSSDEVAGIFQNCKSDLNSHGLVEFVGHTFRNPGVSDILSNGKRHFPCNYKFIWIHFFYTTLLDTTRTYIHKTLNTALHARHRCHMPSVKRLRWKHTHKPRPRPPNALTLL